MRDKNILGTSKPIQYLYILSHMRSRSTLLAHILGSNSAIEGYTELHQSYWSRLDLIRMCVSIRRSVGGPLHGNYRLDKVLHNFHRLSPRLIAKIKPKVIFMLRPPVETFDSLYSFGQQKRLRKRYTDHKKILRYYQNRLTQLEEYSRLQGLRGIYLDSTDLVHETERTLENLSDWLHLENPLSPNYLNFRFTGTNYKGDTSEHIRSGRVLAETSKSHYEFPPEVLEQAEAQYLQTRSVLMANCGAIPATTQVKPRTRKVGYFPATSA